MAEVDDTFKRIQSAKGVVGCFVLNSDGIVIKTTMDGPTTTHYATLIHGFFMKSKNVVRDLDAQNELQLLRMRTNKHEIIIAPDKEYILITIQTAAGED